ncbi:hypothetical protein HAX54_018063 [Datura stramonium]|uniref:RING-type E3 ubiquitin transferase n=1 Tax=Datura stramonium TaxID=4076 RepID=A0ABS8S0X4_DATST|nr:hypothetical protein [Datura stramonium]
MIRTSAAGIPRSQEEKAEQQQNKSLSSAVNVSGGVAIGCNNAIQNYPSSSSSAPLSLSSSCVAVPDVWCGPGIGLTTESASVDCVVSRRPRVWEGKELKRLEGDLHVYTRMGHHRHSRHGYWKVLAEIVMLQNSLMGGRTDGLDDLGTGDLAWITCLMRQSHSLVQSSHPSSCYMEEYEAEDEMGKLDCGHFYHIRCIKQWLSQKNSCPVCKSAAMSNS